MTLAIFPTPAPARARFARPVVSLLPLPCLLVASPLWAATSQWIGFSNNSYHNGSNWTNGVPNSGDIADFSSLSDVRITNFFAVDSFLFDPGFSGGNLIFGDFNPFNANFTGAGVVNQSAVRPRFAINSGATLRFLGAGGSLGFARYQIATGGALLVRGDRNIDGASASIELNGGTFGVVNPTDGGTVNAGSISGNGSVSAPTSALIVGGNNTDATFSGSLGAASVTKVGSGTWTLAGVGDYAGPTLISAGAIKIANSAGSVFGTGSVTTAPGATLTGAGFFSGAFQNNGLYAPGNSPTLATLSSFSQGETGVLEMEIAGTERGTGHDALDITGAFEPGGTLRVLFIDGFSPQGGESFDLFNWGSIAGTFASLELPSLAPGLSWDASALQTAGVLAVAGSAIPEPSGLAALAGLGALGLAATRRRRPAQGRASPSRRRV
jgi:autotransporter-associated beta strand protein